MKKIVLALTIVASALVLSSCASKNTDQMTTTGSDANVQTSVAPSKKHCHRHHHDYKGETSKKLSNQ